MSELLALVGLVEVTTPVAIINAVAAAGSVVIHTVKMMNSISQLRK